MRRRPARARRARYQLTGPSASSTSTSCPASSSAARSSCSTRRHGARHQRGSGHEAGLLSEGGWPGRTRARHLPDRDRVRADRRAGDRAGGRVGPVGGGGGDPDTAPRPMAREVPGVPQTGLAAVRKVSTTVPVSTASPPTPAASRSPWPTWSPSTTRATAWSKVTGSTRIPGTAARLRLPAHRMPRRGTRVPGRDRSHQVAVPGTRTVS